MFENNQIEQLDRWLERLKKYCWLVTIASIMFEIIIFFGCNLAASSTWANQVDKYIVEYIVFPSIRNILFVVLGTLGMNLYLNKKRKIAAYIGFITISFIITNFVYMHIEVGALVGLIFLPTMLSIVIGDKEFTDHIALLEGFLLLVVEIKVVNVLDLSANLLVANIVVSAMSLVIIYGIARGILDYYGDLIKSEKAICEELEEIIDEAK